MKLVGTAGIAMTYLRRLDDPVDWRSGVAEVHRQPERGSVGWRGKSSGRVVSPEQDVSALVRSEIERPEIRRRIPQSFDGEDSRGSKRFDRSGSCSDACGDEVHARRSGDAGGNACGRPLSLRGVSESDDLIGRAYDE